MLLKNLLALSLSYNFVLTCFKLSFHCFLLLIVKKEDHYDLDVIQITGMAIAEIEFLHPDHVSRAEKSWKLIASSLRHVLECDVQLKLKLIPTYIRKRTKVKKLSFSFLSCSGRKQQMSDSTMTDENESETSSKEVTFTRTHSSQNGLQLSSCVPRLDSRRIQEVCVFHDKQQVIIRKAEEDMRSSKATSNRCATINLQNECQSKSSYSKEVGEEGQCIDIQECESQPDCFAKTLKLRRRFLSADAAQSVCLRIQPQSKQELTSPKKVVSETYFNKYDPYSVCSRSNSRVTYSSGEENV